MRGFRFSRGIIKDVITEKAAFGHYRFEIDVPEYEWALDQQLGEEFAQRARAWIDGPIGDVLARDAEKLDAPLGFLRDSASCSFSGIGARGLTETGEPDWQEEGGLYSENWSRSVRDYDSAIDDAEDTARDIGDNGRANKRLHEGVPFPKSSQDSKPFFLIWRRLVWRVNTVPLEFLGTDINRFFEKQDDRWKMRKFERAVATKIRKRRAEAAKAGWKTRKRAARLMAKLEEIQRAKRRRIVDRMYQILQLLEKNDLRINAQVKKLKSRKKSGLRINAQAKGKHAPKPRGGRAKPRGKEIKKVQKTKHKNRRNPRSRG